MTPLGDTMSLVDGYKGDLPFLQPFNKKGCITRSGLTYKSDPLLL